MEFQILDIFLPEFLLRRKENDIIGICSHHSGIAKNPFPIFHIVYCSYVEKLWNSVGIQIFCFSLHRDFLKVSVQYLWNSDQKWNSASKGGSQKSENYWNSQPSSSKCAQRKTSEMESYIQRQVDASDLNSVMQDLFIHWDDRYSAEKFPSAKKFFDRLTKPRTATSSMTNTPDIQD